MRRIHFRPIERVDSRKLTACAFLLFGILSLTACESDGLHSRSRPLFLPDGESILASVRVAGRAEVFRFDRHGRNGTSLTPGIEALDPAISADAQTLAFVRLEANGRGTIWIGDPSTRSYRKVATGNVENLSMAALPVILADGRLVYFQSTNHRSTSTFGSRWTDWRLFIWNPASGASALLQENSFLEVSGSAACGSGAGLFIGTRDYDATAVNYFSLKDGSVAVVKRWADLTAPAPLSDCQRFVAIAQVGEEADTGYYTYELVLKSVDKDESTQLTHLNSFLSSPSLAPDGRRMIFLSDPGRDNAFQLIEYDFRSGSTAPLQLELK
jgi:Tol biopolymer transport system component